MRLHGLLILVATATAIAPATACDGDDDSVRVPSTTDVRVLDGPGGEILLSRSAFVAATPETRRDGLSAYDPITGDQALLMVFPEPQSVCIWNGPVDYAIDVLWAGADGTVTQIVRFAANEETSHCHGETRWILEVEAGGAADVMPGHLLEVPPEG